MLMGVVVAQGGEDRQGCGHPMGGCGWWPGHDHRGDWQVECAVHGRRLDTWRAVSADERRPNMLVEVKALGGMFHNDELLCRDSKICGRIASAIHFLSEHQPSPPLLHEASFMCTIVVISP